MYIESLSLPTTADDEPPAQPLTPSRALALAERLQHQQAEESVCEDAVEVVAAKCSTLCNLLCRYQETAGDGSEGNDQNEEVCYEYADPNKAWLLRPRFFDDGAWKLIGQRMGEHAAAHGMKRIDLLLHGGEPMLMLGKGRRGALDKAMRIMDEAARQICPDIVIGRRMQSNGTRFDKESLQETLRNDVYIGVSSDGDADANHSRVYKNGHDASAKIEEGLMLISQGCEEGCPPNCNEHFESHFAGIISVIDLENDPVKVYEAHAKYNPDVVVLNLPYFNHDSPPPNPNNVEAPYGKWLVAFWERWKQDRDAGKRVPDVRLFSSMVRLAYGKPSETEYLGPLANRAAFITTASDENKGGLLTGPDYIQQTGDRATFNTGLNLAEHTLDEYVELMRSRGMFGRKPVAKACGSCALLSICGGGHLATRYSKENGYDNPSVYCEDMKYAIPKIVGDAIAKDMEFVQNATAVAIRAKSPTGKIPNELHPNHQPELPPLKRCFTTRIRGFEYHDPRYLDSQISEGFYPYSTSTLSHLKPATKVEVEDFVAEELLPRKYAQWDRLTFGGPKDYEVIVAEIGNRVIGHVGLILTPDYYKPGRVYSVTIDGLYADLAAQDSGVEEVLLAEIERKYATQNIFASAPGGSRHYTILSKSGFVREKVTTSLMPPKIHLGLQINMIREVKHQPRRELLVAIDNQRRQRALILA